MKSDRTARLAPITRFCAAIALVIWTSAWVSCWMECSGGDIHAEPDHHQAATASQHSNGQPADSHKDNDHNESFCDSLKSIVHVTTLNQVPKADFGLAFTAFVQSLLSPAVAGAEPPLLRQPEPRDWVLTPEVCLGPAFRSHAPPVSSVT